MEIPIIGQAPPPPNLPTIKAGPLPDGRMVFISTSNFVSIQVPVDPETALRFAREVEQIALQMLGPPITIPLDGLQSRVNT
jgi:hypothetical protein